MNKNNFDLVMHYIDNNIHLDVEEIKKGIYDLIGYSSHSFGECFKVLSKGKTLFRYISERKVYFAAQEMLETPESSIAEIATKYYSEQSSFTRAMKQFFDCTPDKVRKGVAIIPDNKYSLSEFLEKTNDTAVKEMAEAFESGEDYLKRKAWVEEFVKKLSEKYYLAIDEVYLIIELADRLDVPVIDLAEKCIEVCKKAWSEKLLGGSNYYAYLKLASNANTTNVLGVPNYSENLLMDNICSYYNCKQNDIDDYMVKMYCRNRIGEEIK